MNVIERLNEKYKDICFIDCYMNPTMKKRTDAGSAMQAPDV